MLFLWCFLQGTGVFASDQDEVGGRISEFKVKIGECLDLFERGPAGTNEASGAGMEASVLLSSYSGFTSSLVETQLGRLTSDGDFMDKLASLYIVYAAHILKGCDLNDERPYITPLVEASGLYLKAYKCLDYVQKDKKLTQHLKRIDIGLSSVVFGCKKYNDWFVKDTFMNPEGREWRDNPAPDAAKIRKEIAIRIGSVDKYAEQYSAFEKAIEEINACAAKEDGVQAFKKMIECARCLGVIRTLDPQSFIEPFKRFNIVANQAMPLVKKAYSNEDAQAFREAYQPLVEAYKAMQVKK